MLPHMATTDAARDMDRIREALGEAKLTYFGFSYGTFLGTVYAGLFPDHVRALVLDGAIDPLATFEQRRRGPGGGVLRALTAFLDECKADTTCAFNSNGDPAERVRQAHGDHRRKSLPAIAIPDPRPVGPGEAFTGVLYALYSKQSWPILAQASHGRRAATVGVAGHGRRVQRASSPTAPIRTWPPRTTPSTASITRCRPTRRLRRDGARTSSRRRREVRPGDRVQRADLRILADPSEADPGITGRRGAADPRRRHDGRPGDAVSVGPGAGRASCRLACS